MNKRQYSNFIEMLAISDGGLVHLSYVIQQDEISGKLESNTHENNICHPDNVFWYIYLTHADLCVLYILYVLESYISSSTSKNVKDYLLFLQRI